MFQLQAKHQHAAGLFKGRVICFYNCFATQAGCQQALLKIHYYVYLLYVGDPYAL